MKMREFLEMDNEKINKLLMEIAEKIGSKSHRAYIGMGWEYDPIEEEVTLKFRFKHVYIDLPRYESLIKALKEICEEYGFVEEYCYITFNQNFRTLTGYVDIEIVLKGEEDDNEEN